MARSTFGSLQEFQPDSESITAYLERTSVYFTANSIVSCPKFYRHTLNPSHCSLLSDSTFTDAIKPMESLLLNLLLSYDDWRHTVNLETNSMMH